MKTYDIQFNPPIFLDFQRNAPHFGNQVPVQFRIGDIDLLVSLNEDGSLQTHLPLLVPAFATFGAACLRLAKQRGRSALVLDDYGHELLFQMMNGDILVCSTISGRTVQIDYEVL